ncbi:MAG: hypothetical protein GSR77_05010 [Desulfurococcales archaeon]|nr:hypothetical protein [Desulfurococcales archaeon]
MSQNNYVVEDSSSVEEYNGEKILEYIALFFIGLVFFTLGISGKPAVSSITISLLIIVYAITISLSESYIKYVLVALVSTHIGSIISYYSSPLILPFVIIERSTNYSSINIDFVQIILAYEIIRAKPWKKRENSKTPNKIGNDGNAGEAAVV